MASVESTSGHDSLLSGSSYDSEIFVFPDEEKKRCVETLHCSKNAKMRDGANKMTFNLYTSHWVRSKTISSAAYSLLKVKRWYLVDENYVFDPLKQNKSLAELTSEKVLWRTFQDVHDEPDQPVFESDLSVDGILHSQCTQEDFDVLKNIDAMLEPLDKVKVTSRMSATKLFNLLDANSSMADPSAQTAYTDLLSCLTGTLFHYAVQAKVPEYNFEEIFMNLVKCLSESIGGQIKRAVRCNRRVDIDPVEKILLPVRFDGKKEISLEVTSKPNLFLYYRNTAEPGRKRTILGVIEVKGIQKSIESQNGKLHGRGTFEDKILHSDDEDAEEKPRAAEETYFKHPSSRKKCISSLHTLEEDDSEEEEEETDLEKLITETPGWLKHIRALPSEASRAVKKFLPQLIGEMLCASRSQLIHALDSKSGLLFGIGIVGFNVFFVTMLDLARNTQEFVVNKASAHTTVFITRPLNLLVRKDRRVILKTLVAAFYLDKTLEVFVP